MEAYRIDDLGESYLFMLSELSDENIKKSDDSKCKVEIKVSIPLEGDYELRTNREGEQALYPDILRAFSAFLGKVRGYPKGSYDITLDGRRIELSLTREGFGGCLGTFRRAFDLHPQDKSIPPDLFYVNTARGIYGIYRCDNAEDFDIELVGRKALMSKHSQEFIRGIVAVSGTDGCFTVVSYLADAGRRADSFSHGAVCAYLSMEGYRGDELRIKSPDGESKCIYRRGEVYLYSEDIKVFLLYR
jgi:hypothetical protein